MKTHERTELIEVTYWVCTIEHHRHQTRAVAEACLAKHDRPKAARIRWTKDMMADLGEAVLSGKGWREAGEVHGISAERARQVVHKAQRMMRHPSRLVEEYPEHDCYSPEGFRSQRDFWMRQFARFRNEQPN